MLREIAALALFTTASAAAEPINPTPWTAAYTGIEWVIDHMRTTPTDIPKFTPRANGLCQQRDPAKIRACLATKFQTTADPYAAMWDPNWVSSITPDESAAAVPKSHTPKTP